ncbi:MAG: hypothetical protein ACKO7W_03565 [Elainella sp.]
MAEPVIPTGVDATDPTTASFDAQQMVEDIKAGEQKAPSVDVDADYERSKQFDVAEIDRTGEGAIAAESLVSGQAPASGDPAAFMDMAKQVTPDSES